MRARRSGTRRVGVMTCTLDEAACAAFTVGAFADLVDTYVLIDTGSTDGTLPLIENMYAQQISDGRLIVEQLGRLPDFSMAQARARALEILRAQEIDYFLKIDADEVFYDAGAHRLVQIARRLPSPVTYVSCSLRELYQWELQTTSDWLQALDEQRDVFWEMSFVPHKDLVFRVTGAYTHGRWTDEAQGLPAEGIAHHGPMVRERAIGVLAAHYGWARPVECKRAKSLAWHGDPAADPRVDRLHHLTDDRRRPRRRFRRHPEVIRRKLGAVREWLHAR